MSESGSGSNAGGSFVDIKLSDVLGAATTYLYDKERTESRVGSGGNQTQTTTAPNSPPPAPVSSRDDSSTLPTWAKYLLVGSAALLVAALAYRALK